MHTYTYISIYTYRYVYISISIYIISIYMHMYGRRVDLCGGIELEVEMCRVGIGFTCGSLFEKLKAVI